MKIGRYLITVLLLALPLSVQALTNVTYDAATGCYRPKGAANGSTLAAAVGEVTWDGCLVLPRTRAGSASGNWVMDTAVTIPSTLTLKIEPGVQLNCNGFAVAINGPVDATGQAFTNCGSGLTIADHVNSRWFGDDAAGLNAAFAAATKSVRIPGGTYTLTSALTASVAGVDIYGDGYNTNLAFNIADGIGLTINAARIRVRNLRISGTIGTGLYLNNNANFAVIERVDISGATEGTDASDRIGLYITGADDVTIQDNTLSGNGDNAGEGGDIIMISGGNRAKIYRNRCMSTTGAYGIQISDTHYSEVVGNTINAKVTRADNVAGYGIAAYMTAAGLGNHNKIIGNTITNTEGTGIYLLRSSYSQVKHNTLEDVATVQTTAGGLAVGGIVVVGDTPAESTQCQIEGNIVRNSGQAGIRFSGTYNQVMNNIVDGTDNTSPGIWLSAAGNDSTISKNIVRNTAAAGINATATITGLTIIENTIDSLPATTGGHGIIVNTSTNAVIMGNRVTNAGARGIYVLGARPIIQGNIVTNSSQQAANTFEGIRAESNEAIIKSNHSFNSGATGQSYGIALVGDYGLLEGNHLYNNQTAGYSLSGTAITARNNRLSHGASQGVATLVGGTVTVSTAEVRAASTIIISRYALGGTAGNLDVTNISAGTSFDIVSSNGSDTSAVSWMIVH